MQHLAGFRVVTQSYHPAPLVEHLANLISAVKWFLLLLLLLPRQLFPVLLPQEQQRTEAWIAAAESNKMVYMAIVFLGGQIICGMLLQSVAFEIYYGRDLVWSALERHAQGLTPMPTGPELLLALEAAGAPLRATHM